MTALWYLAAISIYVDYAPSEGGDHRSADQIYRVSSSIEMQAGVVVVDDRDPRIDYTTAWYNNVLGQGTDYNQTVSVSGNLNAAFQFTFHGTSVSVYGSIPPNNTAISMYILDISAPVNYTNVPSSVYTSRHLCFQSPTLPDGEHTLVVNIPESTIGHDWTQFYFDFLAYVPSGSSAGGTSAASSPTTSSSGVGAISPTGAAAQQTTPVSFASSSKLKTILPAVLVPCLVCIALLIFALHKMRRRVRRAVEAESRATPYVPPTSEVSTHPFFAATYPSSAPATPTFKAPTAPSDSTSALSSAVPALPAISPPTLVAGTVPPDGDYAETAADSSLSAVRSPSATLSPTALLIPTAGTPTATLGGGAGGAGGAGGSDGMERVRQWARAGVSAVAPSVATEEPPPTYRP